MISTHTKRLRVNSANKVDNLNADQVDGKDQSAFASVSEFDAATVISRWSAYAGDLHERGWNTRDLGRRIRVQGR